MAFRISPGTIVTETDATVGIPAVATTEGGFAGHFRWGPVEEIMNISNEDELVQRVLTPDDETFISFFVTADFLSYAKSARVVRASATGMKNATANGNGVLIKTESDYEFNHSTGNTTLGMWAAKWPGDAGNGLKVSMYYSSGDYQTWAYEQYFDSAPTTSDWVNDRGGSNDELHIVVIDELGKFSDEAGTVLERFGYLSKALGAKTSDGSSNYYKDVINQQSKYIWWQSHPSSNIGVANVSNWGSAANTAFHTGDNVAYTVALANGAIAVPASANTISAYNKFLNASEIEVSFLITGNTDSTVQSHVIQNIAEVRKDCIAFVSPSRASVINNADSESDDIISDKALLSSSSYYFMDSGWYKRFDKYNNTYRWIPLNGGTAGLAARTDLERDPWWSFGGFNRGQYKNVTQLAWNPSDPQDTDDLYRNGINPVVAVKGEGVILMGDKTGLTKPSAFDRVNVRRLFIVLEKAIAKAAKYSLFEFNDSFTRSQFVAMVEPFLRDVQSRRGIYDFRVVCDETNNTAEVIDRNEFVGDIYIKPARSINFIRLNFVAVRSGVDFSEIAGGVGL